MRKKLSLKKKISPESSKELSVLSHTLMAEKVADFVRAKKLATTFPTKSGPKEHVHLEGWLFMGKLFKPAILPDIEWCKYVEYGTVKGWEARVSLKQEGKTVISAEAGCFNDETNWKNKPLFQLKSMSQTRATGKAFRLAFGEIMKIAGFESTPYEEMDTGNDSNIHTTTLAEPNGSKDANLSASEIKRTKQDIVTYAKNYNVSLSKAKEISEIILKENGYAMLQEVPFEKITEIRSKIFKAIENGGQ